MTKISLFLFCISILISGEKVFASWIDETQIPFGAEFTTSAPGMTEEEFNSAIAEVNDAYKGVVSNLGGRLWLSGSWRSNTLNAGATRMFGFWRVQITGAIARRPEITKDGFQLILCHELGHHIGGFPFAKPDMPLSGTWASNEGQADYFSTHVCARKLWYDQVEINETYRTRVTDFARTQCERVYSDEKDRAFCYRTMAATTAMTNTMAGILKRPAPSFETPDDKIVVQTSDAHPRIQCRMDTAMHGALCPLAWDEKLIPGDKVKGGRFSAAAEKESSIYNCTKAAGFEIGARPTCWFRDRL